jgi:hypothetical protein
MWFVFTVFGCATAALMLIIFADMRRRKRARATRYEETALMDIAADIGAQLHAACPGSRWRWVCYPKAFATDGGIARIEVLHTSGKQQFMDACHSQNGYLVLHVTDATELMPLGAAATAPDFESQPDTMVTREVPLSIFYPPTYDLPYDEEGACQWYNIILIDRLRALIANLNADGEVCLYLDQDGKAYTEDGGNVCTVYDFGEMLHVTLWEHITEKLGEEGLFAEVQENSRIFISWA